jgi:anti-sigma regulatory factor (Ser/Thr protein kinase)
VEALLIDEWLTGLRGDAPHAPSIPVLDEASLTLVRQEVRACGANCALGDEVIEPMALVATELARNHLRHAVGGRMLVRPIARAGVPGLEVVAVDRGGGLVDPVAALAGAPRSSGSLGVGFSSAAQLSGELDIDVRLGEGTLVRARKFAAEVPRRREVGIYGRAIRGEARSGDHACFARLDDALVVGVCDGLGHGDLAREASSAAVRAFHEQVDASPVAILEAANTALHRTRGAVMAVARVLEGVSAVEVASVGNIGVQAVGMRRARRFGGSSFVLGTPPQRVKKVLEEHAALAPGEALVLYSDGVSSRLAVEHDLELLRQHPIVIAARIVAEHGRAEDDVLVLVAK